MNKPEFIILGGSAGSFQVIFGIIKKLPANFDVPILIVMHRGKDKNTHVEEVIAQQSKVKVQEVKDKERIINGTVYLAPPDYHVLIEPEKIFSLDNSEPVLFSRPSIDVSMQSAAEVYKKKLLAILFSGANSDGAVAISSDTTKRRNKKNVHTRDRISIDQYSDKVNAKNKHSDS
jgi:two-component system chemotaxis response regulator CheB